MHGVPGKTPAKEDWPANEVQARRKPIAPFTSKDGVVITADEQDPGRLMPVRPALEQKLGEGYASFLARSGRTAPQCCHGARPTSAATAVSCPSVRPRPAQQQARRSPDRVGSQNEGHRELAGEDRP